MAGTISGSVVDDNGNAVGGATIKVINENTDEVAKTLTTDSNGKFSASIPESPPTYHVVALVSGEKRARATFPFVEVK